MSGAAFLRLKKLSGSGIVKKAARHNRRVIQAELGASGSIDSARSHLNETLVGPGTADDVATLARDLMRAAGMDKPPRKDTVLAVEAVFSLPVTHGIDDRQYFKDCVEWAASHFGGKQNIISADVHRDEAAPHCHVLILPLVGRRMAGSEMMGNKRKLCETLQGFHESVGARYGLAKAPLRLAGATKAAAAAKVLENLRSSLDGSLKSRLWPEFRTIIESDPGRFLLALGEGIEQPKRRIRTSTQIFTSPGRGPKVEKKPIGLQDAGRSRALSSVGFAPPPTETTAPEQPARPAPNAEQPPLVATERLREDDISASLFDPETGEFRPRTAKPDSQAQAAWYDPDD